MRLRKEQIRDLIRDSVIQAIKKKGADAFIKSQTICPVVSGELKSSGNIRDIENGVEIQYSKEYAEPVERGSKGGRVHIGAYRKKNGVKVKPYSYYAPPTEGQHFIEKSLEESFEDLSSELDANLRSHFRSVTKV